ncbi:ty3-gypsy retrotransposon protein [Cucumis melo var. makuwa]|uniref:Ty3-gypsy retrotransposon protein n=1 Tax=Cucumis melo var. makuwa TaxID=1194695 RepID=A0A5A7V1E9_CUCMM|nr:ty3-gypsy retrotransposon protein [Cucumis melo var. makuwa]
MAMLEALYGKLSPVSWNEKDLEFGTGDKVFLKVAPMKGVLRFEMKGKSSPYFFGPFEILEQIGPMAYRLVLSPSLYVVHYVFHVLMLKNILRSSCDTKPLIFFLFHDLRNLMCRHCDLFSNNVRPLFSLLFMPSSFVHVQVANHVLRWRVAHPFFTRCPTIRQTLNLR